MSCGNNPCQHSSCTSSKLHTLQFCCNCNSSIDPDFRSIICNFCNSIFCISCFSLSRNSSINPNHITLSQTNDPITCNSCLLTLTKGSSKSFGVLQSSKHILCSKCVRKIKSSSNAPVNYNDFLLLKEEIQRQLQTDIRQQHTSIQDSQQHFEDHFDDLQQQSQSDIHQLHQSFQTSQQHFEDRFDDLQQQSQSDLHQLHKSIQDSQQHFENRFDDLQQQSQSDLHQLHKNFHSYKQKYSDRFHSLQSSSRSQHLQIETLQNNLHNIQNLFNQYKLYVDRLLSFQSTYQPLFDQLFKQSSQLNTSVQFLLTTSFQQSPQTEDGEILNRSQLDNKFRILQLQCSNSNHNIQTQINQQNFHIDNQIQQFSNSFNQKLNNLFLQYNQNSETPSIQTLSNTLSPNRLKQKRKRKH